MGTLFTNVLGFPRIGEHRELKKAEEAFWAGKLSEDGLLAVARNLRKETWLKLKEAGVSLIPSNDFSLYDQVLDASVTFGAIPERYRGLHGLELYFAMARGEQKDGEDVTAMEMTKWFDTNYHYIVPEFTKDQTFSLGSTKAVDEYLEAKAEGVETKPVLIGPVSYLLLGKEKEGGFSKLELLPRLLPVYAELLQKLADAGASWIQVDEPYLGMDLTSEAAEAYKTAYDALAKVSGVKLLLTSYFSGLGDNKALAYGLPVAAIHVDLVRSKLDFEGFPADKLLSIGVVDGRNVWKNDFAKTLDTIREATRRLGRERVIVAASCSFLHVPYDLDAEESLDPEIKRWLSFAWQKVEELVTLGRLSSGNPDESSVASLNANRRDIESRITSPLIHDAKVAERVKNLKERDFHRPSTYAERRPKQLHLPLFPTTTIGSFPQTQQVRAQRAKHRKGEITDAEYERFLRDETARAIRWQEEAGLDVLVHGEFERNDMVEYFGEQLSGFTFTRNGWVQSYGSRCVKPPLIYGDVSRPQPMTVEWAKYAQSLTDKPMKGMLTGPITIEEWSFVRDDQPRSTTACQIALAIRDEVSDLEAAGIRVIQIDEPALREGLPLRRGEWDAYLREAVRAFRLASSGVKDETQLHTHMCYSEFNDIIAHISDLDADAITIECSRSQMELLDVFRDFKYPNEIGPGVYDIHSPRVPSEEEMLDLLHKALRYISPSQLWVNPDCGLKTRSWEEVRPSIDAMVSAAKELRREYGVQRG